MRFFPRVIKECKEVISQPLVNIFRKLVDLGEVPLMWRQANVILIFKKGNRALMSNYRLVSLTSIVGKLLESIIANMIREHLEKFSLINDSQLLIKVRTHGIDGKILCWIRSWLSNRQQRVTINSFKSNWGGNKWSATGICIRTIIIYNIH